MKNKYHKQRLNCESKPTKFELFMVFTIDDEKEIGMQQEVIFFQEKHIFNVNCLFYTTSLFLLLITENFKLREK